MNSCLKSVDADGAHLETKQTDDDDLSTKSYWKIYPQDENDRTFVDLDDIIVSTKNGNTMLRVINGAIVENNGSEGK